jgi:hypothetical protein
MSESPKPTVSEPPYPGHDSEQVLEVYTEVTPLELRALLKEHPRARVAIVPNASEAKADQFLRDWLTTHGYDPIPFVGQNGGLLFKGVEVLPAWPPMGALLMDAPWVPHPPLCPRCETPGTRENDHVVLEYEWWCKRCEQTFALCPKCNTPYTAPMSPLCRDFHQAPQAYHVFTAYFDIGLGVEITSLAQRKRIMKENHMDYRDKMKPGEVSAREDRSRERRKRMEAGHEPGATPKTSSRAFSR